MYKINFSGHIGLFHLSKGCVKTLHFKSFCLFIISTWRLLVLNFGSLERGLLKFSLRMQTVRHTEMLVPEKIAIGMDT